MTDFTYKLPEWYWETKRQKDDDEIDKTIGHYEKLQKRYIKQHEGKSCPHVFLAIKALQEYKTNHKL